MRNINQLNGKIQPLNNILPSSHHLDHLLAVGPISKQPMTCAYRIVLVMTAEKNEFVVYNQFFPNYEKQDAVIDGPDYSGSYFEQGNYFSGTDLDLATKRFGERLVTNGGYLGSLYRNESVNA